MNEPWFTVAKAMKAAADAHHEQTGHTCWVHRREADLALACWTCTGGNAGDVYTSPDYQRGVVDGQGLAYEAGYLAGKVTGEVQGHNDALRVLAAILTVTGRVEIPDTVLVSQDRPIVRTWFDFRTSATIYDVKPHE